MQLAWVSYYYSSSNTLYFFSFSHPICCDARMYYSRPPSIIPQIRGLIADSPCASPLRYLSTFFVARIIHCFLPSSIRVNLYPLALLGYFSSWFFIFPLLFLHINIARQSSQRWLFKSKANARMNSSSILVLTPLNHRGHRLYITHFPGGVSGYPRAWYRPASWVRIPPCTYSYNFPWYFFLCTYRLGGSARAWASKT